MASPGIAVAFCRDRSGTGGRLFVGVRERNYRPVYYEPLGEPNDRGEAAIGLFAKPRGRIKDEPMHGEVLWNHWYKVEKDESNSKPERDIIQRQDLYKFWKYLETKDAAEVVALEKDIQDLGMKRQLAFLNVAKAWKRVDTKARAATRRRREARADEAGLSAEDVEITSEASDDSAYESDEEERAAEKKKRAREGEDAMPPPGGRKSAKKRKNNADAGGRKNKSFRASQPSQTPEFASKPPILGSGGLGPRATSLPHGFGDSGFGDRGSDDIFVHDDDDSVQDYDSRAPEERQTSPAPEPHDSPMQDQGIRSPSAAREQRARSVGLSLWGRQFRGGSHGRASGSAGPPRRGHPSTTPDSAKSTRDAAAAASGKKAVKGGGAARWRSLNGGEDDEDALRRGIRASLAPDSQRIAHDRAGRMGPFEVDDGGDADSAELYDANGTRAQGENGQRIGAAGKEGAEDVGEVDGTEGGAVPGGTGTRAADVEGEADNDGDGDGEGDGNGEGEVGDEGEGEGDGQDETEGEGEGMDD